MDSPFFRPAARAAGENFYRHKRPALIVTLGLIVIATLGRLQFKAAIECIRQGLRSSRS